MVIYKATNQINGMVYIGATNGSLHVRRIKHISDIKLRSPLPLHNDIRKYGIDNFKWEVICICPNVKSLNEQEKYYISLYDSFNSGYNLTSGGKDYIRAEETKEKMRVAALNMSDEHKQKMSANHADINGQNNPMYNKTHSDETKDKMRKARLKYWNNIRNNK